MLYLKMTETRQLKTLDGIWNFQIDPKSTALEEGWPSQRFPSPIHMPVPSSYNDITTLQEIRDYLGDVWYETSTYIPEEWVAENVILRFGAVAHTAEVWVNGHFVVNNNNGFLPFEVDGTPFIKEREFNYISVKVNNELRWDMLPPGEVFEELQENGQLKKTLHQQHDFFNYAGIHRSVFLYTHPQTYIQSVKVDTGFHRRTGTVAVETVCNKEVEGVDTIAGLHKVPAVMFSEEFQVQFLEDYHRIFDEFPEVVCEQVWNFADFMTKQDTVSIDWNKKGIFTRDRQPKMAQINIEKEKNIPSREGK